eukprot:851044-Prorocentrum_minimum.AAC.1
MTSDEAFAVLEQDKDERATKALKIEENKKQRQAAAIARNAEFLPEATRTLTRLREVGLDVHKLKLSVNELKGVLQLLTQQKPKGSKPELLARLAAVLSALPPSAAPPPAAGQESQETFNVGLLPRGSPTRSSWSCLGHYPDGLT